MVRQVHRSYLLRLVLAGIVVLAVLGWIAVAIWGDRQRAWGILLTDFLFLSCLAGGLVVWPAVVVASRGQWMGSTQNTALPGVFLLPVCIVILVVLAVGAPAWAPWLHQNVSNSWWLNAPFLFARDIIGLLIFSGLALWFVVAMGRGERPKKLAAWLIFVYAIVYSLLGIDLAMGLDPHWYSHRIRDLFLHLRDCTSPSRRGLSRPRWLTRRQRPTNGTTRRS